MVWNCHKIQFSGIIRAKKKGLEWFDRIWMLINSYQALVTETSMIWNIQKIAVMRLQYKCFTSVRILLPKFGRFSFIQILEIEFLRLQTPGFNHRFVVNPWFIRIDVVATLTLPHLVHTTRRNFGRSMRPQREGRQPLTREEISYLKTIYLNEHQKQY